jgi:hypothetical protein
MPTHSSVPSVNRTKSLIDTGRKISYTVDPLVGARTRRNDECGLEVVNERAKKETWTNVSISPSPGLFAFSRKGPEQVRNGPSESSPLAMVRRRSPAPRDGRGGGFRMRPSRDSRSVQSLSTRPLEVRGGDTVGDFSRPKNATRRTGLPASAMRRGLLWRQERSCGNSDEPQPPPRGAPRLLRELRAWPAQGILRGRSRGCLVTRASTSRGGRFACPSPVSRSYSPIAQPWRSRRSWSRTSPRRGCRS